MDRWIVSDLVWTNILRCKIEFQFLQLIQHHHVEPVLPSSGLDQTNITCSSQHSIVCSRSSKEFISESSEYISKSRQDKKFSDPVRVDPHNRELTFGHCRSLEIGYGNWPHYRSLTACKPVGYKLVVILRVTNRFNSGWIKSICLTLYYIYCLFYRGCGHFFLKKVKIIYVHLSIKDRLLIIPESYIDFLDR